MALATLAPQYADAYAPSRLDELNTCTFVKESAPIGKREFTSHEFYFASVRLLRSWNFGSTFSPDEDYWDICQSYATPSQPQRPTLNMYEFFGLTTYVGIPAQLMRVMDETAIRILAANPRLVQYTTTLYESTCRELEVMGLSANWLLTTFSDPEDARAKHSLFLECRVRGKSYSEILKIWDALSSKVFAHLPIEAQKEIALVLDEA